MLLKKGLVGISMQSTVSAEQYKRPNLSATQVVVTQCLKQQVNVEATVQALPVILIPSESF
jgi:hypothetical protein